MKKMALMLLALVVCCQPALAQDCLEYENLHKVVGRFGPIEHSRGVVVEDGLATIVSSWYKLRTIDVQDPENPVLLGELDLQKGAWDLDIQDGMAYFVDNPVYPDPAQFTAVDISDPTNPRHAGDLAFDGHGYGLVVEGDVAYVIDSDPPNASYRIRSVDISDPATMSFLDEVDIPDDLFDLHLHGNTLYAATYQSGVVAIDVTDPAQMVQTVAVGVPGNGFGITGDDNYLYLACNEAGLVVMDIVSYPIPWVVAVLDTPDNAWDVVLEGDKLYIADDTSVQMIDVSNPEAPVLEGGLAMPAQCVSVDYDGGIVYASANSLLACDFTGSGGVEILGSTDIFGNYKDAAIRGDQLLAAVEDQGMLIYDMEATGALTAAGSVPMDHITYSLQTAGDLVLANQSHFGLSIVDMEAPSGPAVVGHADVASFISDVVVKGSLAFVADPDNGVRVLDMNAPADPQWVGYMDAPSEPWYLGLDGNLLYVLAFKSSNDSSTLAIIDISDPLSPVELSRLEFTGAPVDMVCEDDLVCLALSGFRLVKVDVSDPTDPQPLPPYTTGFSVLDLALEGGILYAGDVSREVRVFQAEGPAELFLLGEAYLGAYTEGIDVSGPFVAVSLGFGGVLILPVQCPQTVGIIGDDPAPEEDAVPAVLGVLGNYPNPFNPGTTIVMAPERAGEYALAVHDLAGKRIRTLHQGYLEAGRQEIYWNGQDDEGRVVSAGVYLVQLSSEGEVLSRKITMVK